METLKNGVKIMFSKQWKWNKGHKSEVMVLDPGWELVLDLTKIPGVYPTKKSALEAGRVYLGYPDAKRKHKPRRHASA